MADENKFDFQPEKEYTPAKEEKSSGVGLEDVLRPAAQGITYGSSDEILGALKAAKKAFGGKLSFDQIKKLYEEERDKERSANKASEEKNPLLYKGVELGAGLLAPGGVAAKGLKEASAISKFGKMALQGAGLGAAAGAGYSEAAPNTPEFAGDVASGAVLGAAPGAAMTGLAGAAKIGQHIPYVSQLSKGVMEGLKGIIPSNVKLTKNVENLLKKIGDKHSAIKSQYEDIIKGAEAEGRQVDLSDFQKLSESLKNEYGKIKSPDVKADVDKVLAEVQAYMPAKPKPAVEVPKARPLAEGLMGNAGQPMQAPAPAMSPQMLPQARPLVSPSEAQNLKSALGQKAAFSSNPNSLQSNEGRSLAGELKTGLNESLSNQLPGLKSADSQYAKLNKTLEQLGLDPQNLYTKNQLTGELEIDPKALGVVQGLLKKATNEKAVGDVAQRKVGLFKQGLQSLGLPGEDVNNLMQKAKTSNILDNVRGKLGSYVGYTANKAGENLAEPTAKILATAPDVADLYDKKTDNSYELSKSTKDASPEDLLGFAETAQEIPGLKDQADRLKDAVERSDYPTTNTVLHDLLQRPSFRKTLYKK